MKRSGRKPNALAMPVVRNHLVAKAMFRIAGFQRKTEEALRHKEKVLIGSAAQRLSITLLMGEFEFDSQRAHHKHC